jgi:hypothetical protein
MMLLPRTEVTPYYAQVALLDSTVQDAYPEWDGAPEAVATDHGVAVQTRPDHLGSVFVEVRQGESECDEGERLVLDTRLTVESTTGVVVGSVIGNELHEVGLGAGPHRLQVHVKGDKGAVTDVCFLIDPP